MLWEKTFPWKELLCCYTEREFVIIVLKMSFFYTGGVLNKRTAVQRATVKSPVLVFKVERNEEAA